MSELRSKPNTAFQDRFSFAERAEESKKIREKHPNRTPVIVLPGNPDSPTPDKCKFLFPNRMTIGEFTQVIRKRMPVNGSEGIMFMVKDCILSPSQTIAEVDSQYRDEDGFLFISVYRESVFG